MQKLKISLLILMISPLGLLGQNYDNQKITDLENKITDWKANTKAPGVSLAFQHGGYYYENAWGLADMENQVNAKPESSYQIASTTKPMTAMAILKLWEMGKLDLDEEVQTYYPYFPQKEYPITIRQLLSHTAGIYHYRSDSKEEKHIKEPYTTQMAIDIFKDWELRFEPGTQWAYTSYGYNLLAAVVEEVSGQAFEEFLKENIWQAAEMPNTMMDDPISIVPNRVRGYFKNNGNIENAEYLDISSRFGGGGVRSTVQDIVKMGTALYSDKILKSETVELMTTPVGEGWSQYGLGIFTDVFAGQYIIMHSGGMPQTSFLFIAVPHENLFLAIGSNLGRQDVESLGIELVQMLSGIENTPTMTAFTSEDRLILKAVQDVFNFGQGYFQKVGTSKIENLESLQEDFEYFNQTIDVNFIKNNPEEAKQKVKIGHQLLPEASFIWDRVGGYMASQLGKSYSNEGALAFFADYIQLYQNNAKIPYRFSKEFENLVQKYAQDWKSFDEIVQTNFDENTDWSSIQQDFDKNFKKKIVYPNFYGPIVNFTYSNLLLQGQFESISQIATVLENYYPERFWGAFLKGMAHLNANEIEEAKNWFEKANARDNRLERVNWIGRVIQALAPKNPMIAIQLGEIAAVYHPNSYEFQIGLAGLAAKMGLKEKSVFYAEKALVIRPEDATALQLSNQ